ncbi:MAG TPA: hypothetical protein VK698_22380 [Kofleriaceae bacterium]|nr:hypothetical protein [Kofleriaceae bacterium]
MVKLAGQASARGVAALPGGGAVAVGGFEGSLAAGSAALTSAGRGDGFALGLSPAGDVVWSAALRGAGDQDLTAVASGTGGALAVAGTSTGPAELGGKPIATSGQPGAIAARLDARGQVVWTRSIAATDYAVPTALAWTADGDVVVAGYFAGSLDPGGAALVGAGSLDVWVARLAGGDGRVVWLHRAGGPGADSPHAIVAVGDGAVVAGSFQRWADFSSSTVRGADQSADPFVALVGVDGFGWARSFAADGAGAALGLCAAADGRLAVAMTIAGVIEVGGDRVASGGESRGLVALLDASGEPAWARPVDQSRSADAVACGARGVTVVGAPDDGVGYAAMFSPAGAPGWSRPLELAPAAIAASGDGAVVGGGGFIARLRGR